MTLLNSNSGIMPFGFNDVFDIDVMPIPENFIFNFTVFKETMSRNIDKKLSI